MTHDVGLPYNLEKFFITINQVEDSVQLMRSVSQDFSSWLAVAVKFKNEIYALYKTALLACRLSLNKSNSYVYIDVEDYIEQI